MRWRVRCALGVYLIGFAEGTCAHAWDLARGGIHAYAFAPVALQVFFVALVVLDPLVVVLVARARPAGITLAGAVMAADVTANWIADWPILHDDPGWLWRPVGLLPITLFGLFVLATMPPLRRALTTTHQPAPPST
ncbi:hypothetical protein [Actinomadura violacea]|uniref:Uncharacterized protein n=1 Tax=Actinomadura violacea TaxID=2819934 RepID=A0ABS3S9P9_9ACTN|nr:hypothetical protein [Actinomadura violacea]MBO2465731.1 hypothetical protein [Actinomadura violacea]